MERIYSIFIFGIAFNILFGTFGYAFSSFTDVPYSTVLDISIDKQKLFEQGIVFLNATSYEIEYQDDWLYITENNKDYRINWYDPFSPFDPDGLHIEQQTVVEEYLDTWYFPEEVGIALGLQLDPFLNGISNASIINYFETDNNWTRFSFGNGLLAFINTYDNNITRAVQVDGAFNVTIGEPDQSQTFDIWNFINWYLTALFTFDDAQIPAVISVVTKLIATFNVVSAVLVFREATKV